MSDAQWKMLVRFMLFAIELLSKAHPLTVTARVEADQLKDDLELELK